MQKVTVYYFKTYDINTDQMVPSKRMATLEAIKGFGRGGRGSIPLMDTAKEVNVSEIDDNGRYPKISL